MANQIKRTMKELSIEEKAKRYDEAIEKFDVILNLNTVKKSGTIFTDDVRKILPELIESEDDVMRKMAIKAVHAPETQSCIKSWGINPDDVISWLEKQGEQEEPQFKGYYTTQMQRNVFYKVGDWIIRCAEGFKHNIYLVTEVKDYYVCEDLKGRRVTFTFNDVHKNFRLWNISDAKDGDVLQLGKVTAIFKEYTGNGTCRCYCSVCEGEFEIPADDGFDNSYGCSDIYPATKEQRDHLFQKMKEAGYEWDTEKKEPKKIHVIDEGKSEMDYCFTKMMNDEKVSPTLSDVDEADLNNIIWLCNNCINGSETTWIPSQAIRIKSLIERIKDIVFLHPKQEWSEEDEENLNQLHKLIVKKAYEEYEIDTEDETLWGKHAILDNWLKSIKERLKGE